MMGINLLCIVVRKLIRVLSKLLGMFLGFICCMLICGILVFGIVVNELVDLFNGEYVLIGELVFEEFGFVGVVELIVWVVIVVFIFRIMVNVLIWLMCLV